MAVSLVKAVLTNGGTVVRVCRCRRDVCSNDVWVTVTKVGLSTGLVDWAGRRRVLALDDMQEKWTA